MRDTIFISHATPEDNDFTIWLASRLELLGYKVWIDKDGLLGGERFWKEIDQIIRKSACKILLVYSNNICYDNEPGELKTGINKEIELAESIAANEKIKDFIIPLHIDNSRYNQWIYLFGNFGKIIFFFIKPKLSSVAVATVYEF